MKDGIENILKIVSSKNLPFSNVTTETDPIVNVVVYLKNISPSLLAFLARW